MKKKIKVNTIQKNFILVQLHDKPQCGYDLMTGFKKSTGKTLSQGTLYPFLHELAKNKYIEEQIEKDGSRIKKVYHLTAEGKTFVRSIFRSLDFLVTKLLSNCTHCGREFYDREMESGPKFCCVGCKTDYIPLTSEKSR